MAAYPRLAIGLALVVVGICHEAKAEIVSDTQDTISMLLNQSDGVRKFSASGVLTARDGNSDNKLGGPQGLDKFKIPGAMGNWDFKIGYTIGEFNNDGPTMVRAAIEGEHIANPHPNELSNTLPEVLTNGSNMNYGKALTLTTGNKADPHLNGNHKDSYMLTVRNVTAHNQPADSGGDVHRFLTGGFEITATHPDKEEPKKSKRSHLSLGSSASNSNVSYDADSGMLSFNVGTIDILDANGGLSGGIDSPYAADPAMSALLTVSDLEFQGVDSDGRYRFGDGIVTLTDPQGNFQFTANFDEYLIDDTSDDVFLSSFALLDEFSIVDLADLSDGASRFLQDFVDTNLHGHGLSAAEFENILGIDFAFVTAENLATLTGGFTQSLTNISTATFITANVPEPATLMLLALGGLAMLRRSPNGGKSRRQKEA